MPAHLALKVENRPATSPLSEIVATLMRQLGAYWAQAEVAALTQKVSDLRIAHTHLQKSHERLNTLARLDRDWDSYGGSPPTAMAISAAHGVLIAVLNELGDDCASSLSPWTTAPLHNGGIQFEWKGSEGLIEIEVSPSGELSYLLDRETGEIEESENGLDAPVDIVVRRIRSVLVR